MKKISLLLLVLILFPLIAYAGGTSEETAAMQSELSEALSGLGQYSAEMEKAAKEEGLDLKVTDSGIVVKDENGESARIEVGKDGAITYSDDTSSGQFGGEWPKNEFTRLIPKPDKGAILFAAQEDEAYTIALSDVTATDMKEYADKAKRSGFSTDISEEDQEMFGIRTYTYQASNRSGSIIEISFVMGMGGIVITK